MLTAVLVVNFPQITPICWKINFKCNPFTLINQRVPQSLCLLRRAVLLCASLDSVSPSVIAKNLEVDYTTARGIFNRLVKEGAVKDAGPKRGERLVQKEHLENVIFERVFQKGVKQIRELVVSGEDNQLPKASLREQK
ncbi:HORMA domain-containing protein 2 [Fasciolopsis buskii]|uniref:HORMA domain-containing protein 2 n=1 Tax=Fasciolopsis buskii TaxID=27845 RepID=A0A8E0VH82_9TREM|nr:HORMA domain-containing protein 2 [Fasciolopsis buski]